uniref:Sugar phosphate transporter domain-containing protein n=1 Tax=Hanusia phi TaxID=3032 RepID=A0A7S0F0Q5_9CRYP|mmetsp:Transcript_33348/g.74762  ORF Transcript_33348/g.74762 Transcript_33348/m.74762 type:complete len:365 (+) Transcript_33348:105-1199(+)
MGVSSQHAEFQPSKNSDRQDTELLVRIDAQSRDSSNSTSVQASQAGDKGTSAFMDRFLDALPGPIQFTVLASAVFIFFGAHNYLQEAISRMQGFEGLGSILGYLEVMGVMVCSFFERMAVGEKGRTVKAMNYMKLTMCLLGTSYLSTVGLNYINYPTKVVFRSCKLIPTMGVALVMHHEKFSMVEVLSAVCVCAGLAMFAFADMSGEEKVSTAYGMSLQGLSVVADSFLPNYQQGLFRQGASTLEVTYYTNLYVFVIMTFLGGGTGHLMGAYNFILSNAWAAFYLIIYTIVAYVAISFHMRVVSRYGSVIAVLVGNIRKAGTIALSFLLFPKPFSWFYVYGTLLVFGGLTATAYIKDRRRRSQK